MSQIIRNRAKNLRRRSTDAERYFWYLLRNRNLNGYKFKRQYIIGTYIVDFVCIKKRLVIELDGGQHSELQTYDDNRTEFLNSKGYKVLRFWNIDVFKETEKILNTILMALNTQQ